MDNSRYDIVSYSKIITPDDESKWYYSYQELQIELNDLCKNHILKKAYVDLQGYLESFHHSENYYDFSYLGDAVILLFDNIAIEIHIHGTGMVQYRTINLQNIEILNVVDVPPSDMGLTGDNYFYDLGNQFQLSYEKQEVMCVQVDATDCYPFGAKGYDEQKARAAEKTHSLPNNIHFMLENNVDFGIYADEIELFYIKLISLHTAEQTTANNC